MKRSWLDKLPDWALLTFAAACFAGAAVCGAIFAWSITR